MTGDTDVVSNAPTAQRPVELPAPGAPAARPRRRKKWLVRGVILAVLAVGVGAVVYWDRAVRKERADAARALGARVTFDSLYQAGQEMLRRTGPPPAGAAAAAATSQPDMSPAGVEALIRNMGAVDEATQEDAVLMMRNLPPAALPALEATVKRTDLAPLAASEVRRAVGITRRRAAIAAFQQRRTEHDVRSLLAAYDSAGKRDPRWDGAAREALGYFALPRPDCDGGRAGDAWMIAAFQRALEQGCDDPLVRYCEAKLLFDLGTDAEVLRDAFTGSADGITARPYPPFRRCFAWIRAAQVNLTPVPNTYGIRSDRLRAADMQLQRVRQSFPEVAAEPGAVDADVYELALLIMDTSALREQSHDPGYRPGAPTREPNPPPGRKAVFDAIFPAFQQAFPKSALPLALKGKFYTDYAWEARGGGWASEVTPEGWRGFNERLGEAEKALTEAWRLDPNEPTAAAPTLMITVKLGQGEAGGGRKAMEQWFDRALDANPDCLDACDAKLHYLQPKWYGSAEEMLKFGQWCAETQHHRGQIPMVYWETIEDLAELAGNREQLLRTPAIWAGERTLFERQLKVHPLDWENRSLYVRMARDAGDWDTARRQTEALGGFSHPKIFPDKSDYDRIVAAAAKRAK